MSSLHGKEACESMLSLSLAALCPLLRGFELLDDLCLQLDKKEIVLLPKLVMPPK